MSSLYWDRSSSTCHECGGSTNMQLHFRVDAILRTLDDPVVVVMGGLALAPVVEAPCAYCRGDEYWIWRSTKR